MGKKKTAGLVKRNGIWHIDKVIHGRRLCESTGSSNLAEAERYLTKRTSEIVEVILYGSQRVRIWREAATRYLQDNLHKARIEETARHLKQLESLHW